VNEANNKYDRIIVDAKAGFAAHPELKPVRQTFANYDSHDRLCGVCALTAAYVKHHPDAVQKSEADSFVDDKVGPWARNHYKLTIDEMAGFTAGFDGWSRTWEDAEAHQAGYSFWEAMKS
jgi:hypothetical protein